MSEFISQFKIGHYLVISNDKGSVLGFKLPASGIYTISAIQMGAIVVKRKLVNNEQYNWLIITIDFITLRDTINSWKVFDRSVSKDTVQKLYG